METSIPIEVKIEDEAYKKDLLYKKKKELLIRMMEYYGAFRMRKIGTKSWLARNYEIMDE